MSKSSIREAPLLRTQLHEQLRTAILSGIYQPGEQLSAQRISAEYGISPMPVREALRVLEEEGLVETAARRWTRVVSPGPTLIDAIYPIIGALEALAVTLAHDISPETIPQLEDLTGQLQRAHKKSDMIACLDIDDRFHALLTTCSHNNVLSETLGHLKVRIRLVESMYFRFDDITASIDEHHAIITALAAGKHPTASKLIEEHWRRGATTVKNAIHNKGTA